MTKEQLISILRQRLTVVSTEITKLDGVKHPDQQKFLFNHGAIAALHVEQLFLAGLIADIEREGVQP